MLRTVYTAMVCLLIILTCMHHSASTGNGEDYKYAHIQARKGLRCPTLSVALELVGSKSTRVAALIYYQV